MLGVVMASGLTFATELRRDLCARNIAFAGRHGVQHVESHGGVPVYFPSADGRQHGNFLDSSYRAILKNSQWAGRLGKIHTSARRAIPAHPDGRKWCELDSCMS